MELLAAREETGESRAFCKTAFLFVREGAGLAVDGESVPCVAGWGEDGTLEGVAEFAETIDADARRIEDPRFRTRKEGAR